MLHDQADELRHLARRHFHAVALGPAVRLVVASGGKGGVGTTTLATNLAVALARQGRRAVLVDADLDHPGHAQPDKHGQGSIADVLSGRRTVHEVLERGPFGIQVVRGRWASGGAAEYSAAACQRLIGELKNLSRHADVVVIDAGNGRGPLARCAWQAGDLMLAITSAEPAAIMECYAAIKVLSAGNATLDVHTLVNHSVGQLAVQVHARIAETCRRFLGLHVAPAGEISSCEPQGAAAGPVIFPHAAASAVEMDAVAARVWNRLRVLAETTGQAPAAAA